VHDEHWWCYVVKCDSKELFALDSLGHKDQSRKRIDKVVVCMLLSKRVLFVKCKISIHFCCVMLFYAFEIDCIGEADFVFFKLIVFGQVDFVFLKLIIFGHADFVFLKCIVFSQADFVFLTFTVFAQAQRLQHMFSIVGMDVPPNIIEPKVPLQPNK